MSMEDNARPVLKNLVLVVRPRTSLTRLDQRIIRETCPRTASLFHRTPGEIVEKTPTPAPAYWCDGHSLVQNGMKVFIRRLG